MISALVFTGIVMWLIAFLAGVACVIAFMDDTLRVLSLLVFVVAAAIDLLIAIYVLEPIVREILL